MAKKTKTIETLEQNYYPLDSKNKIIGQFPYNTDLYIITRCNYTYKVFLINEDYPEGIKFGESDTGSELLNKIPHYWG